MTESHQYWGLLGPDGLASSRRVRTLDVGAAVRQFNELAVPGMGSVWTGRQLLWPVLGVAAATLARATHQVSNIEAANAVEALACRLALASNKWKRDARIRGLQKLQSTEDLRFAVVRRPGFYVSQPMRMSAVQPLLALGLVESQSERFNAYKVAEPGEVLLSTACDPFVRELPAKLARWMTDEASKTIQNLRAAITPLEPLPDLAAQALRERLEGGSDSDSRRRRAALAWVRSKQSASSTLDDWNGPVPAELAPEHWTDLRAGASFFAARDAALAVLDACEHFMGPGGEPLSLKAPLPESVLEALDRARGTAADFLAKAQGQSYHASGMTFCHELAGRDGPTTLKLLVGRDGRVLRLSGNDIMSGMAFDGGPPSVEAQATAEAQDGDEATAALASRARLPANISFRMRNLLLLDLDLQKRLGAWLAAEAAA